MRKRHYSKSSLKTAIQKRGASRGTCNPKLSCTVVVREGVNSEIPAIPSREMTASDGAMQIDESALVVHARACEYTFGIFGKWSGWWKKKRGGRETIIIN